MHLVVDVTGTESSAQLNPAASIALGAVLRSWRHDEYRTKLPEKRKPTLARITIVGGAPETAQLFQRMGTFARGVFLTRSEERRVGKACFHTYRSRSQPYH